MKRIIKLSLIILILAFNAEAQDNIWIKQPQVIQQPAYNPYSPPAQVYQPSRQLEQQIINQKALQNQILERQIYKTPDWIDPHVPRNQNQQPVIVIGD